VTKAAVFSPAARRELVAAIHWIKQDNPAAARALSDGVLRAARRIGDHVLVGASRPELANERYCFLMVGGFPYVIVYNADHRPPLIMHILHGARDLPEVLRGL